MKMLDLCCGRWGWSRAFASRGWDCVGFDLTIPPSIPARCSFVQQDILELNLDRGFLDFWEPDFICASPPCTQFSTINNFMDHRPYPEAAIHLFNHTREICRQANIPYVIENVAGAMRYVGTAASHCGPFYLWGSAVPPLLPQGINKGLTALAMGLREKKGLPGWDDRHGRLGRTNAALVATIPSELANCVVDYAERLLEVAA